eukprot:scaffold23653_cov96-Phaeocystis_antarctica.AAC.7
MGVRTQIFGTRTELVARAHGAWRLAAALRHLRKFHTKCVPSQLILRMKNSGSEESLAVDAARFCVYVTMAQRDQRGSLMPGQCRCPGNTVLTPLLVAVGAPESGESPRDWRHSPPGEAALVDEATTTKWHVKHGPTERRHASQSDASNLD